MRTLILRKCVIPKTARTLQRGEGSGVERTSSVLAIPNLTILSSRNTKSCHSEPGEESALVSSTRTQTF